MKRGNKDAPKVTEANFTSYEKSIPKLLEQADFKKIIKKEKKIILKPNLTLCKAFPTTTDPVFVEEIIKYIRKYNKKAEIIIAEGSEGDKTNKCYRKLGYEILSKRYKVQLLDLNETKTKKIKSKKFKRYSFIEYPEEILSGFLISLPVLKEDRKTKVTISLKNMLGCFGGSWKKTVRSWPVEYLIHDILVCKFPDYTICDASVCQLENEINGYPKELNLLLAGDPLEVDKKGALLLGYDWRRVPHLILAEELKNQK
jgi:uncharacterized protein (DUF362 family)